ncbi:unnamed protein product [Aphis gossypii]|uniref:Uncharacterized protein n=1 Tax=Aphis gossypii TaxID=80765 RepID=A0A9P0IYY2_APHGO|nr:unnamed protein product [Aphis gossypii]
MRRILLAVFVLSVYRRWDGCAYPTSAESATDGECRVAVQQFRSVGLYDTPTSRIDQGDNLKVCQSKKSCCNAATEARLIDMVDSEYKRHLAVQAGYVYDLLNSTAHHLQEHMTHMIRKSKSKTVRVLADVYASIEGPAVGPLDAFYGRLSRYVHEDPETTPASSLEDAASRLFTDLFPIVYRTVAVAADRPDGGASEFDEDYVQCLAGKALDVKPFGDVPYTLAKDISRTFSATNVLVHALRYGGQLVDEEHSRSWLGYGNREQCSAALTKMRQCSWCDGKDAKPCHGLCVNVIRGCLARETAHLDAPWTGYYEAVDRLVSAINNGQSSVCLEDLLRSLHSRISEAIMYAMNHASDIQNNVKYFCGPAKWNPRAPATVSSVKTPESQEVWNVEEEDLSTALLTSKLTKFSDPETAVRVRGLFSDMAQSMCTNYTTTDCWNGRTVGEYTDNVVGPLLSAQMYNPEFDWTSSINTQDNKVAEVIDKLRHIRQTVLNQLSTSPQSDSFMADEAEGSGEGSGAGRRGNPGWDDDDDNVDYSSGEGSGDNPITTQVPGVDDPQYKSTNKSVPNSGSDETINSNNPSGAAPSTRLHAPLLITVCLMVIPVLQQLQTRINF